MKDFKRYALFGFLAMLTAILGDCTAIASVGQQHRDINALAGICMHELTWEVDHDCPAIYEVMRARQVRRGYVSLEDAIRTQCRRFYRGLSNRSWARLLRPNAVSVRGWPSRWGPVERHHESIAHVFDVAEDLVVHDRRDRCNVTPNWWGSRRESLPDVHRARRAVRMGIWREVDCGPTIQAYYAQVAWVQ